jgi:hypothetical protein
MTMNTNLKKLLVPLAAITLLASACDPFPAKPGGDPAIVRVITYAGSLGTSNTVETVSGGNTVSTDFAEPDGTISVQFNKPMDGSTIQLHDNYYTPPVTVPPTPAVDPCTPAVGGINVSEFPAGTTTCYNPSSATDGGQIIITPGAPLVYGTTYHVTGTVKDYEGKAITLNVSVTVDKRPLPFSIDGYTAGVDWFDSSPTSYEVLRSTTGAAGSYTHLATVDPAVDCDGVLCEIIDPEKVPGTDYYYQVKETTGTTTTDRPAAQGPTTTFSALTPTLGVASTTTPPPVVLTGIIRVAWGAIHGANGYDVDRSTDGGATWAPLIHQVGRTYYDGTAAPGTAAPTTNGSLVTGTVYTYRVTPTFADAFAAEKGNAASKAVP